MAVCVIDDLIQLFDLIPHIDLKGLGLQLACAAYGFQFKLLLMIIMLRCWCCWIFFL